MVKSSLNFFILNFKKESHELNLGFLVVAVKEHGENTTPHRRQATSATSSAASAASVGLGLLLGLLVVGLGLLVVDRRWIWASCRRVA